MDSLICCEAQCDRGARRRRESRKSGGEFTRAMARGARFRAANDIKLAMNGQWFGKSGFVIIAQ
jgi:hypothetical protein